MPHTIDQHFDGRAAQVRDIYDTIVTAGRVFGHVVEDIKKTSVHLNRKTAFAGIMTRRDYLILTIKSKHDIDSPRISKREQASANRWHHEMRINAPDEVDAQIIGWLRDAYAISG